ncbi:hypothetical protein M426DRAFT_9796, partial [Hypoxylon sp. CI-4A]
GPSPPRRRRRSGTGLDALFRRLRLGRSRDRQQERERQTRSPSGPAPGPVVPTGPAAIVRPPNPSPPGSEDSSRPPGTISRMRRRLRDLGKRSRKKK